MSDDNMTLGERLRTARAKAGLSIRELERLSGVTDSYLTKLELNQKKNPSADVLQRLADVLELDAGTLLAYIGVKPSSVLPPMSIVLRSKYNLTEAEAQEAVQLIEERYGINKEVKHDKNNPG